MEFSRVKHKDGDQVKAILCDAIKILCGNTVSYDYSLSIEALIGITIDKSEVILINVQELLEKPESKSLNVYQELNDSLASADNDPDPGMTISSNGVCVKTDPTSDDELFDILSNEVIQIDDDEKKDFDDLQAIVCIKEEEEEEEDQQDCLASNGRYSNRNSSRIQSDNLYMDDPFDSGEPEAFVQDSRISDSRSFTDGQKWMNVSEAVPQEFFPHPQPRNSRTGGFNCRLCKKTFSSREVYFRHKKKHHYSSKPAAESTYGRNARNINHDNAAEENWMTPSDEGKRSMILAKEVSNMTLFTCSICGKTIRHQSSFLRHKRQHEGIVYKCDICGTVLSRRDALQVHKRKCAMKLQQQQMSDC